MSISCEHCGSWWGPQWRTCSLDRCPMKNDGIKRMMLVEHPKGGAFNAAFGKPINEAPEDEQKKS